MVSQKDKLYQWATKELLWSTKRALRNVVRGQNQGSIII